MAISDLESIIGRVRAIRSAAKEIHDDLLQLETTLEQGKDSDSDKQCSERILKKIAHLCSQSGAGYAAHEDLVRQTTNMAKDNRYAAIESLIRASKIEKLKGIGDRPGPAPTYYRLLVDISSLQPSSPAREVPIEVLRPLA
jgi:hypothetical protein